MDTSHPTGEDGIVVPLVVPDRLAHRSEPRHISNALAEFLEQIRPAAYCFGCVSAEDRGEDLEQEEAA